MTVSQVVDGYDLIDICASVICLCLFTLVPNWETCTFIFQWIIYICKYELNP